MHAATRTRKTQVTEISLVRRKRCESQESFMLVTGMHYWKFL